MTIGKTEDKKLEQMMKNLQCLQREDSEIQKMILKAGESPFYTVHDGILFKKIWDGPFKAVIPKILQIPLIKLYHDNLGHFGASKCAKAFSENFV